MGELIYGLCALTALFAAGLLLLGYRRSRYRLLLWSGLCFAGLAANNALLVLDEVLLPLVDLSLWRALLALAAMAVLLFGLIWDAD